MLILYFVKKKFYNIYLLNCDTVNFYETEILNFNFNQPERTQSFYYEPEAVLVHFEHCTQYDLHTYVNIIQIVCIPFSGPYSLT